MNLRDLAILNINGIHYCYIIDRIRKTESVNLLQKADLKEKNAEHYVI